jgi:hypothetical protein
MTKILIDLTTIKKNPDYVPPGCKKYIAGLQKVSFICKGCLPSQFTPDNVEFTSIYEDPGHHEGLITNIDSIDVIALEKEVKEKNIKIAITVERETIETTSLDNPKWYFEYVPTFVICGECGSMFSHEYLKSDDSDCGDNYSSCVCPVCGEWDCCEVEYEDIQDAFKRKAIAEAPSVNEFAEQVKDLQDFEQELIAKTYGINKEDLKFKKK